MLHQCVHVSSVYVCTLNSSRPAASATAVYITSHACMFVLSACMCGAANNSCTQTTVFGGCSPRVYSELIVDIQYHTVSHAALAGSVSTMNCF